MQLDTLLKTTGPVLITGHTGFKGTWLTLLLETLGLKVCGYSLPPISNSLFSRMNRKECIPEFFGDVRDSKNLNEFISVMNPEIIIHLAAQPLVIDSYTDPVSTFSTNVMGTVNLLNAGFQNPTTKCLAVITTDKVYRNNNTERRFTETDALAGKDPYSASKVAAEAAITAWQNISAVEGKFPVLSLRAGNVIGGGDLSANRLMPDVVRNLHFNASLQVRNPLSTRPWQHVLDPLVGYLLAINRALTSQTSDSYNFAYNEKSLSVGEVLEYVNEHSSLSFKANENASRPQQMESLYLELDSSKAVRELSWEPKWNQQSAIFQTLEWWKSVISGELSAEEACRLEIQSLVNSLI